jgi:hypothetical protein
MDFKKVFKELQDFAGALIGNTDLSNEEKFAVLKQEAKEAIHEIWEAGEDGVQLVLPGGFGAIFNFVTDNGPVAALQTEAEDALAGMLAEAAYRAEKAVRERLAALGLG